MQTPNALPSLPPRTPFGGDIIGALKGLAQTKNWMVPERGTSEAASGSVAMVEEDAAGVLRVFDRLGSTARMVSPATGSVRPAFTTDGRWSGYNPIRFAGTTDHRYRVDNFTPDLSQSFTFCIPFELEFDAGTGIPVGASQNLLGKQTSNVDRFTVEKPTNQRVLTLGVGAKQSQLIAPRGRTLLTVGITNGAGGARTAKFGLNKTWAKDLDVTGEPVGSAAALAIGALSITGTRPLFGWLGGPFFIQGDLRDDPALSLAYSALLTHYRTTMGFRV